MNNHKKPVDISGIKNITISGRIGTGKTTLANNLGISTSWKVLDGGKLFRKITKQLGLSLNDVLKRPDNFDIDYEEKIKIMLQKDHNHIIQSHLAGFDAQGLDGIYKILVVCEDEKGKDDMAIRIDRIMNRDLISIQEAKIEVHQREDENLEKFRRLYVHDDPNWVYWDRKYYDLVVNTFYLNQNEAVDYVLKNLKF